jgi:hypothetical protein
VMDESDELRKWLLKAFDYTSTLPAKTKRATAKPSARIPTPRKAQPKTVAKQRGRRRA